MRLKVFINKLSNKNYVYLLLNFFYITFFYAAKHNEVCIIFLLSVLSNECCQFHSFLIYFVEGSELKTFNSKHLIFIEFLPKSSTKYKLV